MRISALYVSGFRGVKEPMEITFPSGFVVISGRNGTGKSSVCDAIEFAITGSITKYSESSEKGENVSDYLWWRGAAPAEEKVVMLKLVNASGAVITITRRPDGVTFSDGAELLGMLCDRSIDAEKALTDVCRTSIIRDEFITSLSVDLAEPERFTFVKAAVGSASFAAAESKLVDALRIIKAKTTRTKPDYDRARDRVKDLMTDLSRAQAEASKGADASKAEIELRRLTNKPQAEFAELLSSGRKVAPELRLRIDALERLATRVDKLFKREAEVSGESLRIQQGELAKKIEEQSMSLLSIQQRIVELEALLLQHQERDSASASLAQLQEHGSRLGLANGHCPLCGSSVSEAEFRAHLAEITLRLKKTSEAATDLVRRRAELSDSEKKANAELSISRRQVDQLSMTLDSVDRERRVIAEEMTRLGLAVEEIGRNTVSVLRSDAESSRARLAVIETNVAILEASKAHGRVADLQKDLSISQQAVVATEKRIAKQEAARLLIERASATLKRVSSEIVDDRLAAIRPLLAELYVRLRPHVDWPEISYLIRGDTRRFLSLRVGDGLNLRFMFSSGQRRAAGLAFLMAVSLSRPWCLLESLIFDDPVQHIDDFRALHLVESLSALRQVGRQVICTVEDSALAELLARRLRSSETDEGALVEMDYESQRGAFVSKVTEILPFSGQVLRTA